MSKIFITVISVVTKTVMIVPLICGTTTRKKICRSPAPSIRAASSVSTGTPLIAAESSTIAKPICAHSSITISSRLLRWNWSCCSHGIGLPPRSTTIAFCRPICSWPSGRYA